MPLPANTVYGVGSSGNASNIGSDVRGTLVAVSASLSVVRMPERSLLPSALWRCSVAGKLLFVNRQPLYWNREVAMTMTPVFSGFDPKFYPAGEDEYPLGEEAVLRVRWCTSSPAR
ncbi:Fructosamine_kinase (plasmid) [Leishmania braziliensis MHOM/BR/75/M2904]|uniref:Fructosamine_kinase n=1 Tax=Leishmania braziliensis MHOM/BR/75/M2904 TaxID=420245 RepID=A0A3P3Z2S7_LEIBR|nr:unnamed protein product [Leishmania braziliensis]CAJ2470532.1 unnamed protein product [Leishmania braziliensis]SYZ64525.1 Fructosamine_kinase [Leishmania braziliensis MHOM/BR/75/M2904]